MLCNTEDGAQVGVSILGSFFKVLKTLYNMFGVTQIRLIEIWLFQDMNPGFSPQRYVLGAYRIRDGTSVSLIVIFFGEGVLTETVVGGQGRESRDTDNLDGETTSRMDFCLV